MGSAFATSLWTDDGWFADPYSDRRVGKVGDIVTVIIEENTKGNNTASSRGIIAPVLV